MSAKETNSKLESSASHIHRKRLTDDFKKKIAERRLILVIAPPGYGKSAFLADAAGAVEQPVCSVSLSGAEGEVGFVDAALRQSLVKRFRRLKDILSPNIHRPASGVELDGGNIGRALAENVPEDHLLVIDQVERLVGNAQAIDYLNDLYRSLPPQCTMVLAGRSLPDLNIASDLAANRVKHYGAVELAFDYEEMVELVQARLGERLDEDALAKLYEQTEGWPTGVLLSEVVQPISDFVGSEHPLVYQYFTENAYQDLPEELQIFLLAASFLPVINPELCDHSLNRDDSQAAIKSLLNSGVFLFRAGFSNGSFFRLQAQYRQFLLVSANNTRQSPKKKIVRRAVEWYEENGLPEYAFKLAIELGDAENAAKVAEKNSGQLYIRGNAVQLQAWAELLSTSQNCAPLTFQFHALHQANEGNLDAADDWYEKAQRCIEKNPNPEVSNRILNGRFLINRNLGSVDDLEDILEGMEKLLPELPEKEMARYLCSLMEYQGWYLRNYEDALKTFELLEPIAPPVILQRALHSKGIILALNGKLNDASLAFNSALDLCDENNFTRTKISAFLNIGTAAQVQGRYFEASVRYQQALALSQETNSIYSESWSLMGIGEILTELSIYKAAEKYLYDAMEVSQSITTDGRLGVIQLMLARCLRLGGKQNQAKEWLSKVVVDPFDWFYEADLKIELGYSEHPNNPLKRFEYLQNFAEKTAKSYLGLTQTRIHQLICLLDADDEPSALQLLHSICGQLKQSSLHNLFAVEISRNEKLLEFVQNHSTDESIYVLQLAKEITRKRSSIYLASDYQDILGLKFKSLGQIEVRNSDGKPGKLRPVHAQTLFCILDNRAISSESLASILWGDLDPDDQMANLHVAIYQIRRQFGQNLIKTTSAGYEASSEALARYDVNSFEEAYRRTQRSIGNLRIFHGAIEEGISLYGGDFLPGYYSGWIINRRRELRNKYHQLLVRYSESAVRQKVPEVALERLRDAVNMYPLEADIAEAYLELLVETGNIHESIMFYRRYKKTLAEELHLNPSERMTNTVNKVASTQVTK